MDSAWGYLIALFVGLGALMVAAEVMARAADRREAKRRDAEGLAGHSVKAVH